MLQIHYRYPPRPKRTNFDDLKIDGQPILFVDTPEKVERTKKMLAASQRIGLDTEFGGKGFKINDTHPYHLARVASMQFSCAGPKLDGVHDAKYIFIPNWGEYTNNIRHFKKELQSEERRLCLHNAKADYHPLANHGISPSGLKSDTMVMAFLRFTAGEHGLKALSNEFFGTDLPAFDDHFRIPKIKMDGTPGKQQFVPDVFDIIDGKYDYAYPEGGVVRLIKYAVKDPAVTLDCDEKLESDLRKVKWHGKKSMFDYYLEFDQPFTEVLFRIERRGMLIDKVALREVEMAVTDKLVEVEKQFLKMCVQAGVSPRELESFNFNSPQKLVWLFQERLGLTLPTNKDGKPTTSEPALETVRNRRARRFINVLLEYRGLTTVISRYIEPFKTILAHPWSDGRVRTFLKQTGAATMRLSSVNPNLQNIPRPGKDPFGFRKMFIASPGRKMGATDLSQVELRIISHVTKEKKMIEAFMNDWDLHSRTALLCFGEVQQYAKGRKISSYLLHEIADKFGIQRSNAKNVNFMVSYGGGPGRYSQMTGEPISEGKRVINTFFREYPGLDRGIKRTRAFCRKYGYIRTFARRYIHIPEINSTNVKVRSHAERLAFNAVAQGSAADIVKMAMLLCDRDDRLKQLDVDMLLQIHDELLHDIPRGAVKEAKPIIEDYMSSPYKYFGMKPLVVPTPAGMGIGANWMEAK